MMQPCHRQAMPCRLLRVVRQVRTEPALNLFDRETTAYGVILDLVATEAADTEVAGGRVREDQSTAPPARRLRPGRLAGAIDAGDTDAEPAQGVTGRDDVVRQAAVVASGRLLGLPPQHLGRPVETVEDDVVALALRQPEPVHTLGAEGPVGD